MQSQTSEISDVGDLFDVVNHAIEEPLGVAFCRPRSASLFAFMGLACVASPRLFMTSKYHGLDLVNQSLFYLSWLDDHRRDFEIAAAKQIDKAEFDWSEIRVICIAPGYKKYDLHAVKMMEANIELWQCKLLANGGLYLDQVYGRCALADTASSTAVDQKKLIQIEASKKAEITRATGSFSFS